MIETQTPPASQTSSPQIQADLLGRLIGGGAQESSDFASILADRRTDRPTEQTPRSPHDEPEKPAHTDEERDDRKINPEVVPVVAAPAVGHDLSSLHAAELSGEVSLADRAAAQMATAQMPSDSAEEDGEAAVDGAPGVKERPIAREPGRSGSPAPENTPRHDDTARDAHDSASPNQQKGKQPADNAATPQGPASVQASAHAGAAPHAQVAPQSGGAVRTGGAPAVGAVKAGGAVGTQAVGGQAKSTHGATGAQGVGGFREVMSRIGAKSGQPQIMRAEAQVATQASRLMLQSVREGRTEVVLRLRPETLGPVKIELSLEDGVLSARLESANAAARELLSGSVDHLRSALEARGVSVDRIQVDAPAEPEAATAGGPGSGSHGSDPGGSDRGAEHQRSAGQRANAEAAAEPWEQAGAAEPAGVWMERAVDGGAFIRVDATV